MPDTSADTTQPERRPITPLDLALARFEMWIEEREAAHAEAAKTQEAALPDDIPRFITR